MISKKKIKDFMNEKLSMSEEIFCKCYVSEEFFGNGVKAYMKAYPNAEYNSAKVLACGLLKRKEINRKILELLDEAGLNNITVDKALLSLILQDDERSVKLGAIREYNSLNIRIEKARQEALEKGDISKDVLPTYTILELKQKTDEELNEERKRLLGL